ncbi:class I SAM-dependent methyltransferase [Myxococcota bacterium]|nr:class I SAM-dependent methyltransferase [Myxococcota bacterium]
MTATVPDPPVSRTALWTAWLRERETARPDALLQDPLSSRLLAGPDREAARELDLLAGGGDAVVIRHAWIDMRVFRSVVEDRVRVVTELGAGLGTRPWRLGLPRDLEWTDVDHPGLLAAKTARLAGEEPRCAYRTLAADLSVEDELARIARDAGRRARERGAGGGADFPLFVLEGVLPYLTEAEVRTTLRILRAEARRCLVVCDLVNPWFLRRFARRWNGKLAEIGAELRFAVDDPWRLFASEGYSVLDGQNLVDVGREMGRWPIPRWLPLPRGFRESGRLVLAQADPI